MSGVLATTIHCVEKAPKQGRRLYCPLVAGASKIKSTLNIWTQVFVSTCLHVQENNLPCLFVWLF